MTTRKDDFIDKRSFTRYSAKESTAAILLTPGNIVSYCILDVSKSGLAFCYNGRADESKMLNPAMVTFLIENIGSVDISVQIVSNTKLDEEDFWHPSQGHRVNRPYLRRCGVKFNSLSPEQKGTINTYIESLMTN